MPASRSLPIAISSSFPFAQDRAFRRVAESSAAARHGRRPETDRRASVRPRSGLSPATLPARMRWWIGARGAAGKVSEMGKPRDDDYHRSIAIVGTVWTACFVVLSALLLVVSG